MLFTRDRNFYRTLFHLMIIVVFQNIIAYSINMADNLMLGMYSQSSLSGAATVNQIQFLLQQMTLDRKRRNQFEHLQGLRWQQD